MDVDADRWLRARRAERRGWDEPHEEEPDHEQRPPPPLVTQGVRSELPKPRPPTADDWLRSIRR
jgi:hypothetical protein